LAETPARRYSSSRCVVEAGRNRGGFEGERAEVVQLARV
jgi:hypothetical protein